MISSDTTPRELARLLGTSYSQLTATVYKVGVNNLYDSFEIPKKSGGSRSINAPKDRLYIIQLRLKNSLDGIFNPHKAASAFITGRGIVYNAKRHVKKAAVFNLDLEDFYDHIHFGRISGLLSSKPYNLRKDTANLIAHICCYKSRLPQGAPTSPILSNMICKGLDHRLSLLAKENRAQYSRYADDITFSFREISRNSIYTHSNGEVGASSSLVNIIESYGFKINTNKTRVQFNNERQVVTGLKVNSKINIDRRFIRTTRALIHSLSKGTEEANKIHAIKNPESSASLETVVYGRLNYIGMVKGKESTVYQSLARKFNNLPCKLRVTTTPKTHTTEFIHKLHSLTHEHREKLSHSVLVLDFDGIDCEDELIQGSAFVLSGNKIITATHNFSKAGSTEECFLYKVNEPSKRYKAKIVSSCTTSDIAELKLLDDPEQGPNLIPLRKARSIRQNSYGYKLSIAGFPQLKSGHSTVSIIPCTVINSYTRSTFKMIEVESSIDAGNSGGPVLNIHMEVVGMATLGKSVTIDDGEAYIEGSNSFISSEHF